MFSSSFQWFIGATSVAVFIIWWGSRNRQPVRDLLAAVWLPLSVTIVAALALFATDLGRDLGVGMLGHGQLKLFLLALALFYWATGSWHAARLGLNRRFGTSQHWHAGYEPWLRWLPRLLGAYAHFFAAVSLTLAAMHAIGPDAEPILFVPAWLFAFVPTAVIVVGVLVLWWHDDRYVAARNAYNKVRAAEETDLAAGSEYDAATKRMYRAVCIVIASGLVIAAGLYSLGDRLPEGLAAATGWVLFSAASFLLVVSRRRNIAQWVLGRRSIPEEAKRWLVKAFEETAQRHALSSGVLGIFLSAVALLIGVWAWWDFVSLGSVTGSMVLGFFAFGAYIAILDLLRMLSRTGANFTAVCAFLSLMALGPSPVGDFLGLGVLRAYVPRHSKDLVEAEGASRGPKELRVLAPQGEHSSAVTSTGWRRKIAIVIGISDYKDLEAPEPGDPPGTLHDLAYAEEDARAFAELFDRKELVGADWTIVEFFGSDAKQSSIMETLQELLTTLNERDLIMLFFAGHARASLLDPTDVYLMTYEDAEILAYDGVPYTWLRNLIQASPVDYIMAFIDACHSGAVGFGRGEKGTIDQAKFQLPASVEPTKVIFTAGTGAQASQEDEGMKHGIFTYFLLNGIEGGAEDDDNDGLVDLAELADYVIHEVRNHTRSADHLSRQVPQLFSAEGLYAEDFPIALRVGAE